MPLTRTRLFKITVRPTPDTIHEVVTVEDTSAHGALSAYLSKMVKTDSLAFKLFCSSSWENHTPGASITVEEQVPLTRHNT